MKTAPVEPATIDFGHAGAPYAPRFGDVYHARAGALAQARHVFLGGNGLPARWQGRDDFTIVETGFGLGHNFLATWDAWRSDPRRGARLHYLGIDLHPPSREDLARAHAASPLHALAAALAAAWPPLVPSVHRLAFEGGRLRLLLLPFEVRAALAEMLADFDTAYLDGFAPARNPAMWEPRVFAALARRAAPGATAATWSAARAVRAGLAAAGFAVHAAAGFADKREMTLARFAPHHVPERPAARRLAARPRRVAVIGGGLAGCAVAAALAEAGITATVVDRRAAPAQETSGNAAGVFHGSIATAHDGTHARFNRAAALHAAVTARPIVAAGRAAGWVDAGLLRLGDDDAGAAPGAPAGYVRALDAAEAAALAGVPLARPAWLFPAGGGIDPAALARALLDDADAGWIGGCEIAALHAGGAGWRLLDAAGTCVLEAEQVVLACGDAAPALAGLRWPLVRVRGQTTGIDLALARELRPPRVPLAGHGYALPALDGRLWCGASSAPGDDEPGLRERDHRDNLERLARLLAQPVADVPVHALRGRVGWRLVAPDRLPVLGPVPDEQAHALRLDQPRFVPRRPGVHVFTALASRGLTWAMLGARIVAAQVAATPCPVESSLLDAVDCARFAARAARALKET